MAGSVSDILKSSLHKEGGKFTAGDIPPLPEDAKLRNKHTTMSVPYNWKHAFEHIQPAVDKLEKMKSVNPKLAKHFARKMVKDLEKATKHVEKVNG